MDDNCDDFVSEPRRVRWSFQPLQDVRPDVAGEVAFIKKWQELMGGAQVVHDEWFVENEPWGFPILDIFPGWIPNERDTRVASSVIRWLGTSAGRFYREEAERLRHVFKAAGQSAEAGDAFIMAWALANRPQSQVNHGFTPRTIILDTPKPDLRDIQTMELTVQWLGSEGGQAFVQECQSVLARQLEQERLFRMRDHLRRVRPVCP